MGIVIFKKKILVINYRYIIINIIIIDLYYCKHCLEDTKLWIWFMGGNTGCGIDAQAAL